METPLPMLDAICVLITSHNSQNDYSAAFIEQARKQVEARGKILIDLAEAKARRASTENALEEAVRSEAEAQAKYEGA